MTKPPAADEPAANASADLAAEPVEGPARSADKDDDEPRFEADYVADGTPTPAEWPITDADTDTDTDLSDKTDKTDVPPTSAETDVPPTSAETDVPPTSAETDIPPASADTDVPPPPPPGAGAPPPPGAPPFGNQPPYGPPPFGGQPPFGAQPPFGRQPPFGNQPPYGAGFNRSLLVRPQQGRYVAGVCAAIGRATNTDPTLWRVIFAVLTLAGGVSIVAYLLGWLLLPAEGDTGSPLEALLGRGRSTTSAPLAIVIGVCAVLAFLLVMSQNFGAALVGIAIVIGVVALVARGNNNQQAAPAGPFVPPAVPNPPPGPFAPAGAPFGAAQTAQFQARPGGFGPGAPGSPSSGPPSAPPAPSGGAAPTGEFAGGAPAVAHRLPAVPPAPPLPPLPPLPPFPLGGSSGYRPPFAPHGPYAGSSPYAASLGYPPPGAPTSPYPGLAPVPPPPKPPKERSKLGRITFSLIVISLGVLAALEVTMADFKTSTYFAVPLAITALGLVVGAWLGRARVLILLGALLSIALAIATAANSAVTHRSDDINIAPTSVSALQRSYVTDWGDVNADLSQINFVDQDVSVEFRVGSGSLDVELPPDVDVTVRVHLQGGDCQIFDNDCSGLQTTRTYTDYGADGQGGGKLSLDLDLQWGSVKVNR